MIRIIIVAMLCCSVAWGQLEMGSSTNVSAEVSGISPFIDAGLNTGLVSYWAMRTNTAANVVTDEYSANNGTAVGGALFGVVYGVRDDGVLLDGVNDYINCGTNNTFGSNSFTVSFWASTNGTETTSRIICQENVDLNSTSGEWAFIIITTATNAVFVVRAGAVSYASGGVLINGNKALLTAVIDRSANVIEMYRNGVQQNSTSIAGMSGTVGNLGTLLRIGGRNVGGSLLPFSGSIDEVALWNRALSSNEVATLYSTPLYAPYRDSNPQTTMAWINNGAGWHHYASNTATYVDGVTNSFTFSPWSWQTNTLVIGGTNYIWDDPRCYNRTLTAGEIAHYVLETADKYSYPLSVSTSLLATADAWDTSAGNTNCVLALDFENVGVAQDVKLGHADTLWDSLAAYWPLDGNGTELIGGFNGTVGSLVTFTNDAIGGTAGKFRKGVNPETPADLSIQTPFRFVGSTNAGAETAFASNMTYSVWAKFISPGASSVDAIFEALTTSYSTSILPLDFGTPTVACYATVHFIPTPSGTLAASVGYTAASYKANTNWTHYAVTWTRTGANTLTGVLYVNGLPVSTNAVDVNARTIYHNTTMNIGQRGILSNRSDTWPGLIDELAIFKRALTSDEISSLATQRSIFRSGIPRDRSSLANDAVATGEPIHRMPDRTP